MADRLVRIKEINECFAIPVSTIWYWVNKGNFPKPIKMGARFIAWRESELNAWLDAKQSKNTINNQDIDIR